MRLRWRVQAGLAAPPDAADAPRIGSTLVEAVRAAHRAGLGFGGLEAEDVLARDLDADGTPELSTLREHLDWPQVEAARAF